MYPLIVSEPMSSKLAESKEPLQLCLPNGQVLGFFTPVKGMRLQLDPGISEEELDRRQAEGGGRPLEDILLDLEKRK